MSNDFTDVQGERYDVVVLGGGNGGYATALRAADLGLSVAVVEADALGGTCLHRGCVPTKALLEAGHVAAAARDASRVGVRASLDGVDWDAVQAFKRGVVERMHGGLRSLVRHRGIDVVTGWGSVVDPATVAVREEGGAERLLSAGRSIVVATGCVPRAPAALGVEGRRVLTSDHALTGPLPTSAIVVGGNYIGIEFATLYRALGASVTLVEQLDRIAPAEDEAVSAELARRLVEQGITVHTSTTVGDVEAARDEVSVVVRADGGERTERAEVVLVAVGREPRPETAALADHGVELEDGFVVVDAAYRTTVPSISAVGDAIRVRGAAAPHPQLAHVAFAEGIRAAEAVAGMDPQPVPYGAVSHVIYGDPEVAAVGLTEEAARAAGHDVRTATYDLAHNARALMFGSAGFVKTVTDERGTILGVHVVGPNASEVLAAGAMATAWSARVEEVAALLHGHPTVGEAFGETALALAGAPLHMAAAPRHRVAAVA